MQAQQQAQFEPMSWSREGLALGSEPATVEPRVEPEQHPEPPRAELPPLAIFSPDTEETLQLYFSRMGQFTEPSNFAAMCERAKRLSHASIPCPACDATGSRAITPDEYANRDAKIAAHQQYANDRLNDARARLAGARDNVELRQHAEELEDELSKLKKAREELGAQMASDAACKVCHGTAVTVPRKIRRGHGDNIATSVWCPDCEGGRVVGRPDSWQLKRLAANLAEVPGLDMDEVVETVRRFGAGLPFPDRWPRAVGLLLRMAWVAQLAPDDAPCLDAGELRRRLMRVMRDPCAREGCKGGYVVPIDVRETGNSIPPGTSSADPADIAEHGEIDRLLGVLLDEQPLAAGVLEAYFGIDGNRWGATQRGRLWAVMPYTKPGATLAREAALRFEADHPGLRLDPAELLARELDEDRKSALTNRRRRMLLDTADSAARNLFESAKRAWARVVIAHHDARDSARAWGHELAAEAAISNRQSDLIGAASAAAEYLEPDHGRGRARGGSESTDDEAA